jgi:glutaredoxin 3
VKKILCIHYIYLHTNLLILEVTLVPKVTIYSTATCPYCIRVKQLLERKGLEYKEIRVDTDPKQMNAMLKLSNRRTVPQIFVGDYHVGGYNDLAELDAEGDLDILLSKV